MKKEMPYKEAKEIADNIVSLLSPFCDKIDIAGSLRRKKNIIGDLEIICLPKQETSKNLFGEDKRIMINLEFQKKVQQLGEVIKGKSDGKYMQIKLPQEINLDLFMPDDFDYYRMLAIRTGSKDYSFKVLANGWRKKKWCGTDKGLRKISDCTKTIKPNGKSIWKCVSLVPELPPHWQSEQEFFDFINVKYVEPIYRNK